ncbi:MAG: hypothetical protein ABSG46_06280 [Candidatus Binataceae bacterium]
MILVSVFAAASVINVGAEGFPAGVSPYYFTAVLIAFRTIPKWLSGRLSFRAGDPARVYLRVMAVFIGWASLSAFLLPIIFQGLPVDLARAGPDATYYFRLPLQWSLSNAGQAGYLILDLIVITYFAGQAATPGCAEALAAAFCWSGVVVVAIGAYQLLAHKAGLPFPSTFFNSNPAWAQLSGQNIGGVWRVSATFDEPSAAGAFFATWTVFEFSLALSRARNRLRHQIFALAGILMVIATTSTTGYLTLAAMAPLLLLNDLFSALRQTRSLMPASVAIAAAVIAIAFAFARAGAGSSLLDAVVLYKYQSSSSMHRMATVFRSINIFASTWGLGAGLGSNRAMSIVAYILSNLGVVGIVLFVWLLISLRTITRIEMGAMPRDAHSRLLLRALGWAFAAHLLAMSESAAEISDPSLWILWSILMVSVRRQWLITHQAAQDPAHISIFADCPRQAAVY